MHRPLISVGLFVGLTLSPVLLAQQQLPPAQRQTFRSRITIVPIDVRVLDKQGKPVTDLKQSDFTISEDGSPQRIVHFTTESLTPDPDAADVGLPFRKPVGDRLTSQGRRIFLLVLGRGRHTGPGRDLDAAVDFVRTRLLPQDQVAVLAYNRSTDFTSDRKQIAAVLDRYKRQHQSIEALLSQRFSGLAAHYSDGSIPPFIQVAIDAIFRAPGAPNSRTTSATAITDAAIMRDDTRRRAEDTRAAAVAEARIKEGLGTPFDPSIVERAELVDMPFDEYVKKTFETNQDLGNLYAGIRYLRFLDGEKHLVFLTPGGLFLPRLENANSLAALANDARVTVDVLHTGGINISRPMPAILPMNSRDAAMAVLNAMGSPSATFQQTFAVASSRQIAMLTGGQISAFAPGERLFRRLDETTRVQYLLGYSPTNQNWNGAYRRIKVQVSRPGVTVLYRHGYAAREEITPLDRRTYLTYSRIASAANRVQPIDDLDVTIRGTRLVNETSGQILEIDLHLEPDHLMFAAEDGRHLASIDATFFAGDSRGVLSGDMWKTLDFALTPENYKRFLREGVAWTQRVPVTKAPTYVKVILYQYQSDQAGSAVAEIRKGRTR